MSQKKHADDQVFESFDKVGGPDFPSEWAMISGGVRSCPGMTLRDWFAGQALVGLLASDPGSTTWEVDAENAYLAADAMLAARSKGEV